MQKLGIFVVFLSAIMLMVLNWFGLAGQGLWRPAGFVLGVILFLWECFYVSYYRRRSR